MSVQPPFPAVLDACPQHAESVRFSLQTRGEPDRDDGLEIRRAPSEPVEEGAEQQMVGGEQGRGAARQTNRPSGSEDAREEGTAWLEVPPADNPLRAQVQPRPRNLVIGADRHPARGHDNVTGALRSLLKSGPQLLAIVAYDPTVVDEAARHLHLAFQHPRIRIDDASGGCLL